MPSRMIILPLVSMLAVVTGLPPAEIVWETDFHAALKRAKEENRVLAIAINMDGERANDEIVAVHYRDPRIQELSRNTVNLFCSAFDHGAKCSRVPGMTCGQHREIDKRVRLDVLTIPPEEHVIAPQHVFLSPDGTVLSSAAYYVTVGQLEWMWADAIRRVHADFAWAASDRAHAPQQLKLSKPASTTVAVKPPTADEVAAILKELKKGFGSYWEAKDKLPIVVRHEGEVARTFTRRLLESVDTPPKQRCELLGIIGSNSPRSWWNMVTPSLDAAEDQVRWAAARALTQLADKRALAALQGRYRKEKTNSVKAALLHAMVAADPQSGVVLGLLDRVLRTEDAEELRRHAAVATARLENREGANKALTLALGDRSAKVRAAAAFAIAARRDSSMGEPLRQRLAAEADADTKRWLEEASKALDGGELTAFDPLLEELFGN